MSPLDYNNGPITAPSTFTNICYANNTAPNIANCCDTGLYAVGNNATYCETNQAVLAWQSCLYWTGEINPVVGWCTEPVPVPVSTSAGMRLAGARGWAVGLLLVAGVVAAGF